MLRASITKHDTNPSECFGGAFWQAGSVFGARFYGWNFHKPGHDCKTRQDMGPAASNPTLSDIMQPAGDSILAGSGSCCQ